MRRLTAPTGVGHSGPFFHDDAVPTIEDAVAFYDGDSFDESPAGRRLASLDPQGAAQREEEPMRGSRRR